MQTTSPNPGLEPLRLRLLAARRARMARSGELGRTIAALHYIAARLDEDNVSSSAARRLQGLGRGPVGYGWGMIERLASRAITGGTAAFTDEWDRLATQQGLHAAQAFGDDITRSTRAVLTAIREATATHPDGDPLPPAEIRALADQLAAKAMPLPGDDRN